MVGLIAIPAMAQAPAPISVQYEGSATYNHSTKVLDPPVFLENTYRNNGGWLSWYPYAAPYDWGDDIGTIYSTNVKEQTWGTNMVAPRADFLMTGFDVGWYSQDTNTGHFNTMTVTFYDNTGGTDYTGESVGTVFVPSPPTMLAQYTVNAPVTAGANFTAFDLVDDLGEADIVMPTDLWMSVQVSAADYAGDGTNDYGVMIAKDWGGPNPWYFYNGGAEYGHSDWWYLFTYNWKQYYLGPPVPSTGPPYYDAYNPKGSFTYSVYGIPEPATLGLLALSGLAMIRRRR
jgi:hypothetical protein